MQSILTIFLKPKCAKSRGELRKGITEGISFPGIGHQILSKELVDEAIIISDMYDLNEYMALDLLCTGKPLIVVFCYFSCLYIKF
jgi:nuclear pore complex protein Nup205